MEYPWLVPLTYALSLCATALAWFVARRRAEHRPIALLMSAGLASDVARRLLYVHALVPGYARAAGGPLTGWARVAGHAEEALFLSWFVAFTAAAMAIFTKRRPWAIFAVWTVVCIVLSATYPTTRGYLLQRVYLGIDGVSLAASGWFLVAWLRSTKPAFGLRHACVIVVLSTELFSLMVGPWRADLFTAWPLAQAGYAVVFLMLIVMQGSALWMSS
jgi:hypothetical protein